MAETPIRLAALNQMDQAKFTATIGFVFEDSPWVAAYTWPQRPFASVAALYDALCQTMYAADLDTQMALIRAHPDLAGRAAAQGTLGKSSASEQAGAGLDQLTPTEQAAFAQFNAAYWDKFDFPFIICVRENKKAGILAGFEARLPNTLEQERATALGEIAKIARLRLLDTVID